MDVKTVRRMITELESAARLAHDAKLRTDLCNKCSVLVALLNEFTTPLNPLLEPADLDEQNLANMAVENFMRLWLSTLRPVLKADIMNRKRVEPAVVERMVAHIISTIILVVDDWPITILYSDNLEFDVRRICSTLLDTCSEVLKSDHAPVDEPEHKSPFELVSTNDAPVQKPLLLRRKSGFNPRIVDNR
jgi:hypothetical protein